jgi:hypothetical protein
MFRAQIAASYSLVLLSALLAPSMAGGQQQRQGQAAQGSAALDKADACVTSPGARGKDPKKHGSPSDRDGDTINDTADACPDVPGAPRRDAKLNGCPLDQDTGVEVPLDKDSDGVHDDIDRCIYVPGLKAAPASVPASLRTDWEARFLGCPEDIDNDAIPNLPDACPLDKGQPSKAPKKNGCPLARRAGAPQPKESAPPPPKEEERRARAEKPALTSGAPAGDTKQQLDQLFDAQHEAFRCCFDAIEAPKKPLSGGKVTLLVKVDGAGKLKGSGIVAAESDAVSPQMKKCINDVASALAYPKPASSLSVGYKRSFDFKPRR